ncbi:sigma-70 region 4 domain-containing protein [Streptomyces echinoruber]|uniref:sigma-70 region 4 domain-containing protein n=1 Tax=Streptomyces echinoruber TaxID=68898 RepID=UPI00167E6272|nr:sigma-70 region 4 domain-containing protein [Streptomyces echinoruber]
MPDRFRLEYFAFRQLHHDAYLDYAQVRTGSRVRAVRCVETVFDRLRDIWQAALRGSPAAQAWGMLHEQANCHSDCGAGHVWPIHCLLEGRQADVVLLHRRLRLSVEEAADLMGVPDYTVRGLLRSADRALHALPPCVAPVFTDALYGRGAHGASAAQ